MLRPDVANGHVLRGSDSTHALQLRSLNGGTATLGVAVPESPEQILRALAIRYGHSAAGAMRIGVRITFLAKGQ